MGRKTNPSGFVKYDDEKELCKQLEKHYFPLFFNKKWKPINGITKEVWLDKHNRIDYFGYHCNKPTYVEAKNWWITNNNIKQIKRYYPLILQRGIKLYIICGGIPKERRKYLEDNYDNITIILIKDIEELKPHEELFTWM